MRSSDGCSARQSMYSANIVAASRSRRRASTASSPSLEAQALVEPVADRLLVLLGDAEQHADRAHRHLRAEVGDEVEAAGADERVEAAGAELADLRLERVHLASA